MKLGGYIINHTPSGIWPNHILVSHESLGSDLFDCRLQQPLKSLTGKRLSTGAILHDKPVSISVSMPLADVGRGCPWRGMGAGPQGTSRAIATPWVRQPPEAAVSSVFTACDEWEAVFHKSKIRSESAAYRLAHSAGSFIPSGCKDCGSALFRVANIVGQAVQLSQEVLGTKIWNNDLQRKIWIKQITKNLCTPWKTTGQMALFLPKNQTLGNNFWKQQWTQIRSCWKKGRVTCSCWPSRCPNDRWQWWPQADKKNNKNLGEKLRFLGFFCCFCYSVFIFSWILSVGFSWIMWRFHFFCEL